MFTITRLNGKSNQQVILDLIGDSEPGTLITYEEFADALALDSNTTYGRQEVQCCVRQANRRLRRERQRTLRTVKNFGYKVAFANEHGELASRHGRKANRQMELSMEILENARVDEMTEQQRLLHSHQLEINSQLYREMRRQRRDHQTLVKAFCTLSQRVDQAGL